MRFKIGEKVKFLDEKGGGKIIAIIDNKLVKVETDDGFEMPVLVKDLIKDFRSEGMEGMEPSVNIQAQTLTPKTATEEVEEDNRIVPINPWGNIREESGVYLAYEPQDQQWVLTGDIDILIVNNTNSEVLYNLFFEQEKSQKGIDYGSIPAKSLITIETVGRDDLENWCSGYLQLMFHDDKAGVVYLPVHSVIDLKPSRFFKEESYQSSSMLNGKAIIVTVAPEATYRLADHNEIAQKYGAEFQETEAGIKKEKALIDKYRSNLFEAIVDLHIGELVDNISGLSNHDIFNLQMETFRKTLDSAIHNDYNKITFIHGVGNGVLKNAIVQELENYEATENRMASISKFGVGAIDILLKSKK